MRRGKRGRGALRLRKDWSRRRRGCWNRRWSWRELLQLRRNLFSALGRLSNRCLTFRGFDRPRRCARGLRASRGLLPRGAPGIRRSLGRLCGRLISRAGDGSRETEILKLLGTDDAVRGRAIRSGSRVLRKGRRGPEQEPGRPECNKQAPSAPHLLPPRFVNRAISPRAAGKCLSCWAYSSTAGMNRSGIQALSVRRPTPAPHRPERRCRACFRR